MRSVYWRVLEKFERVRLNDQYFPRDLRRWVPSPAEEDFRFTGMVKADYFFRRKVHIQTDGWRYLDRGENPAQGDEFITATALRTWKVYTGNILLIPKDIGTGPHAPPNARIFRRPFGPKEITEMDNKIESIQKGYPQDILYCSRRKEPKADPYFIHREKLERNGVEPVFRELRFYGPDLSGEEFELTNDELRSWEKNHGR